MSKTRISALAFAAALLFVSGSVSVLVPVHAQTTPAVVATPVVVDAGAVPIDTDATSEGGAAAAVRDVTNDTGSPVVDEVVNWLKALKELLIPLAIAIGTGLIYKYFGIKTDDSLRNGLQTTLSNGAGVLIQRLGVEVAKSPKLNPQNEHVQEVLSMVSKGARDAISHFGVSQNDILQRLEAKIGLTLGMTDANGVPIAASPVVVPIRPPLA